MHNFSFLISQSSFLMYNSQFSTLNSQLRVETLASSWWFGGLVLIILVVLALSVSAHRKQYTLYVRNLLNKQGRVMNYDQESTSLWADVLLWFVVVSSYVLLLMTEEIHFNFFLCLWSTSLNGFHYSWVLGSNSCDFIFIFHKSFTKQ